MNTIKFRGKILNGERKGEWVYGSYLEFTVQGVKNARIIPMFDCKEEVLDDTMDITIDCIAVDPETIGQYIGVNDKTDTEMYHGDICRDMFGDIGTIEIHQSMPTWTVLRYPDRVSSIQPYSFNNLTQLDEIIGNIHDNKNLFTQ